MGKRTWTILLLCLYGVCTYSQETHLYFIEGALQRSYLNPALLPDKGVSIATGLSFDINTNGPSINDFVTENAEGNLTLSPSNAISKMDDSNDIFGEASIHTIDAAFKVGGVRLSLGHAWKARGWLNYSQDLAALITQGNAQFIGQEIEIGPQIDYLNYNELYLGAQTEIGVLSIGGRIKHLSGVEVVKTMSDDISLYTDDDIYQLRVTTDLDLVSSQAFTYTDLNDFSLTTSDFTTQNLLSANGGWAMDLGASVHLDDKLEISLGIVDIGYMRWTEDTKRYTSNQVAAFDGIDAGAFISSDDELFLEDSVRQLLSITEVDTSFTTYLPAQINLGARLKISELWTIGGVIRSTGAGDRRSQIIGLGANARLYPFLTVGGSYTIENGTFTSIGLHAIGKVGPLRGFVATDNLAGLFSDASRNVNFRAGLSLGL